MSLKKLGIALGALMVIGAVMASSAFATAETKHSRWYDGTTGLTANETREISCSVGEHEFEGEKLTDLRLTGFVNNAAVTLTATGVECLNEAGTVGTHSIIKQTGKGTEAEPYVAEDFGRLTFTGVSFTKPSACNLAENAEGTPAITKLKTEPLKSEIYMEGTKVYDRFEPVAGSTAKFAEFAIGGECAAAAMGVKVTGFVYGESPNATGVLKHIQPLTFNETIQKTAKGELFLGTKAAYVDGRVNNTIVGAESTEFGSKES